MRIDLMRITAYFIISLLIFGCSATSIPQEFTFYDSHGIIYHSSTATQNAKMEYGLDQEPRLIIIATSSENEKKFKKQMRIIYNVNAEQMQYMYVVANSEEEDHSGYYATKSTAKKLLDGNSFKIIIYNGKGKLITQSQEVIGEQKLVDLLTRDS
jgi:uncharacterized protein (UPF0333 family)